MGNGNAGGPQVCCPPPALFLGALILGGAIEWFWPLGPGPGFGRLMLGMLGLVLVFAGAIFALWAVWVLRQEETPLMWYRPARNLVTSGPYEVSRNPIYVGLSVAYIGLAIMLNWWWAVLFLPLVLLSLWRFVVTPEEAHLEARFGEDYREYCERVSRWL